MKRLFALALFASLFLHGCGSPGGTLQVCDIQINRGDIHCIYYYWTPTVRTEPTQSMYALDTSCQTQQRRVSVSNSNSGRW